MFLQDRIVTKDLSQKYFIKIIFKTKSKRFPFIYNCSRSNREDFVRVQINSFINRLQKVKKSKKKEKIKPVVPRQSSNKRTTRLVVSDLFRSRMTSTTNLYVNLKNGQVPVFVNDSKFYSLRLSYSLYCTSVGPSTPPNFLSCRSERNLLQRVPTSRDDKETDTK